MQLEDLLNECMKLAAHEKITSKNSWDLQFIDHIDEMNLEYDFVKASGAINVSAKIYSGRVDKLYQDCVQVANLTGALDDPANKQETENNDTTVQKRGRQKQTKNAAIDAAQTQLQLKLPVQTSKVNNDVLAGLFCVIDNTQQIQLLPFENCYVSSNNALIENFAEYQEIDHQMTQDEQQTEHNNAQMAQKTNNILLQSQRFVEESRVEEVEFTQQDVEICDYASQLDNSMINLQVSQLSEDLIDHFLVSNKIVGNNAQEQKKAEKVPKIPRPGKAKPAQKQVNINFLEQCQIPLINPKQKSKILQKLKDVVINDTQNFYFDFIQINKINQLLISDYQTLQLSQLQSNANLSIIINDNDIVNDSFNVNQSINVSLNDNRVQFGDVENNKNVDTYNQNSQLFKSTFSDVKNYDIQIGLQSVQIKFNQKPKVINIQQLKQIIKEDIVNQKQQQNYASLNQIIQKYPQNHNDKVCKNSQDVSPAYQFVGLLHLANEEGLELILQKNGDILVK